MSFMKVVIYIFAIIGVLLVGLFILGSSSSHSIQNSQTTIVKGNFDGTYNIDYGNSKCGNLGYKFKALYERVFDSTENPGRINKSNCKLVGGRYEGYIYPVNKPEFRVHWKELATGQVGAK